MCGALLVVASSALIFTVSVAEHEENKNVCTKRDNIEHGLSNRTEV